MSYMYKLIISLKMLRTRNSATTESTPVETFNLLTESGDTLTTENDSHIQKE